MRDFGGDCGVLSAGLSGGLDFLQLLFQLRQYLEKIGDEPVIGDLEDRRIGVLVDRDDHLGVFHAREMLDGPGNSASDVEIRGDDLSGLADLPIVRRITGIDRRAAAPTAAPSLSATRQDHLQEFLLRAERRPPETMIFAPASSGRSVFATPRLQKVERPGSATADDVLHTRCRPQARPPGKGCGADRQNLLRVLRLHRLDGIAGVGRAAERVGAEHLHHVGDLHHVEERRDARHDVLAAAVVGAASAS